MLVSSFAFKILNDMTREGACEEHEVHRIEWIPKESFFFTNPNFFLIHPHEYVHAIQSCTNSCPLISWMHCPFWRWSSIPL